jgi:hypothetical protein
VVGLKINFPKDPQEAIFETLDIQNFWKTFDTLESCYVYPFETYIKNGTIGLQYFIPQLVREKISSKDSASFKLVAQKKAKHRMQTTTF